MDIKNETIKLIDNLKATCQSYGLGNDGNEYKIITQVFLYKFLNDKFGHEIKKISPILAKSNNWEIEYAKLTDDERQKLFNKLSPDIPRLLPFHLIANLWNQQQKGDFDIIFDQTMVDIAEKNIDIFSTQTSENTKIPLFEKLTNYVTDDSKRANFARALIDKLAKFSFEDAFNHHYDFFAAIFEYLIKDYNTAGGGKYAEYYTPHSIATIMARLLVGNQKSLHNIECYDPSAGTGTLLMALAHQIGEDKCTVYAQDISQRSNKMLKLNLILNGLVSSLDNAIQGDTLLNPYHKSDDKKDLKKFDFIVSNPPFNVDFSETRDSLASMPARFWAGVPNITPKDKSSMSIYLCFIQHVMNSLKQTGKAAIVVPTGFITRTKGLEGKVLSGLINGKDNLNGKLNKNGPIYGCICMPPNVFANTGTNVSILFLDNNHSFNDAILIDASKMGEDYQENGLKKRRLMDKDIDLIVETFISRKEINKFSVLVPFKKLKERKTLSPGQYFKFEIEHIDISKAEFDHKISKIRTDLENSQKNRNQLIESIISSLKRLNNENS